MTKLKVGDIAKYNFHNGAWGKVIKIEGNTVVLERVNCEIPTTYHFNRWWVRKMTRDEIIMEML